MERKRLKISFSDDDLRRLEQLRTDFDRPSKAEIYHRAINFVQRARESGQPALGEFLSSPPRTEPVAKADIKISSVISPQKKNAEGTLIRAHAMAWSTIIKQLGDDWSKAHEYPPQLWEEIIAATFDKAGFDEVVLTPRSGDRGRDVIATKHGAGSIKLLSSVKAYKPGNLVTYDDVRALLGVLSGERDASKGIITTTSGFPPRIMEDPIISPFLPTRLELVPGDELYDWIISMTKSK